MGANLKRTNLSGADLREADLRGTSLIRTVIDKAKISGSLVYAINVLDLKGEFEEQKDLIITPSKTPMITVDNIKVAQFIHLILNNEEIQEVINTLISKSVLILGRFSLPERKSILDALRDKLREYSLIPIVFDFDRPTDKDFTETIKILAGLSLFVIADITNPKSSPLELQATVPDYQIPFVPIIQEGEQPFAMMVDLQKKYNWVLDTLSYGSIEALLKALKSAIIDPAMEKHHELRLIKAKESKIRAAKDFLDKEKE
jgi:Pentapeptide repeats (8 copies)